MKFYSLISSLTVALAMLSSTVSFAAQDGGATVGNGPGSGLGGVSQPCGSSVPPSCSCDQFGVMHCGTDPSGGGGRDVVVVGPDPSAPQPQPDPPNPTTADPPLQSPVANSSCPTGDSNGLWSGQTTMQRCMHYFKVLDPSNETSDAKKAMTINTQASASSGVNDGGFHQPVPGVVPEDYTVSNSQNQTPGSSGSGSAGPLSGAQATAQGAIVSKVPDLNELFGRPSYTRKPAGTDYQGANGSATKTSLMLHLSAMLQAFAASSSATHSSSTMSSP